MYLEKVYLVPVGKAYGIIECGRGGKEEKRVSPKKKRPVPLTRGREEGGKASTRRGGKGDGEAGS